MEDAVAEGFEGSWEFHGLEFGAAAEGVSVDLLKVRVEEVDVLETGALGEGTKGYRR